MKTIVITGSGRGLGYELATRFRKADFNVVLNDINESQLKTAQNNLEQISGAGRVFACAGDVSSLESMQNLAAYAAEQCGEVDIWINNAGINQPMKAIWELSETEIRLVLDVDLKGAVFGSKVAMEHMAKQGHGAIYNMEGYGSNDAMMLGLNMYCFLRVH